MPLPPYDLPPEREVACACDVRLERPVLRDHTGINRRVSACLRCGEVTMTESLVEEPRPHDVRCVGNRVLAVEPALLAWLARWPRLAGPAWRWRDPMYLPADTRVEDHAELEVLEAAAEREQQSLVPLERLRRAGIPAEPPPPLPRDLAVFATTWAAVAT